MSQGESGDYVPGSGMPTCNDPRLTAGRTLVPGGIVVASLGDGGIPVVTTPPAPLPEAPPISEGPAMAPGVQLCRRSCDGSLSGLLTRPSRFQIDDTLRRLVFATAARDLVERRQRMAEVSTVAQTLSLDTTSGLQDLKQAVKATAAAFRRQSRCR